MKTKKQAKAVAKERSRSLRAVVGTETYEAWVRLLRKLVPDGRTHRLAVMVAGMLHYAAAVATARRRRRDEGLTGFFYYSKPVT